MTFIKTLAGTALLLAATTLSAHADYTFTGTNLGDAVSGTFTGQAAEAYSFNADGGALYNAPLNENNWGSPGVNTYNASYFETQSAYGLIVSFTGGSVIDATQITNGNSANCLGTAYAGTTFCAVGSPDNIWVASLIDANTIEFLAQNPSFDVSTGSFYFANVFFTGATPTAFSGTWLTEYSPNGVPEPTTLMLLGAGLAGLGLVRRRRL